MAPAAVGVVLPAAGRAKRFGSGENKIWAVLAGRTVLYRTLTAFETHPAVACIVLVAGSEEIPRVRETAQNFSKVTAVVAGGETRTASVKNGLDALPAGIDIVLVHDAARPLVAADLIDRVIAATRLHGAAVPGLPLSDTVKRTKEIDGWGIVRETIPRTAQVAGEFLAGLTAVQTPQGARIALLRAAYAAFDFSRAEPTDESSLLEALIASGSEALGAAVAIAAGDPANIKITRPEDLALAERLLSPMEVRTGFGYDVHAFAPPEAGRPLMLGGVEIPHNRGLDGHSDADVVLHAVCDALLGAAALGDIGILFPNTDPAYKGISSLRLLAICGERLTQAGWRILNIDATALAEAPKLMPYRAEMQRTMAACLGLEPERISIKATTSEKLGFVGREEGIACWAVATLQSM